jgi:hypothetical protein
MSICFEIHLSVQTPFHGAGVEESTVMQQHPYHTDRRNTKRTGKKADPGMRTDGGVNSSDNKKV